MFEFCIKKLNLIFDNEVAFSVTSFTNHLKKNCKLFFNLNINFSLFTNRFANKLILMLYIIKIKIIIQIIKIDIFFNLVHRML